MRHFQVQRQDTPLQAVLRLEIRLVRAGEAVRLRQIFGGRRSGHSVPRIEGSAHVGAPAHSELPREPLHDPEQTETAGLVQTIRQVNADRFLKLEIPRRVVCTTINFMLFQKQEFRQIFHATVFR